MGEQEQYRVLIEGYLLWPQKSLAWAELCLMGQRVSAADEGVGVSRMVWTHPELLVMPVQRPSQTWLRSSIALAHSPVPEHSISTKKNGISWGWGAREMFIPHVVDLGQAIEQHIVQTSQLRSSLAPRNVSQKHHEPFAFYAFIMQSYWFTSMCFGVFVFSLSRFIPSPPCWSD